MSWSARRKFDAARYTPDVLRKAIQLFDSYVGPEVRSKLDVVRRTGNYPDQWQWDTGEEFFAELRKPDASDFDADYWIQPPNDSAPRFHLGVSMSRRGGTHVSVRLGSAVQVNSLVEIFEEAYSRATPVTPPPCVFLGHGHSEQWIQLRDHLRDMHKIDVRYYESDPRAGEVTRDVLESLLSECSFAVLLMTAEDETREGSMRARQNVVHEIGLFQGRLGWKRVVVVLEEGTERFTNGEGLNEIRYRAGAIREALGDVVAVINREGAPKPVWRS